MLVTYKDINSYFDMYRPGQPNWEYTMWKFQDFSVTQILREINFGHFEALKTAILTLYLEALNFGFSFFAFSEG